MLPMPGARTLPCRPQGPSLAPRPGASPCLGKLLPEERCRATVCPGGSQPSCRTQRAHSPHAWSRDLSARRDRCWASPSRGHLSGAGGRRALETGGAPFPAGHGDWRPRVPRPGSHETQRQAQTVSWQEHGGRAEATSLEPGSLEHRAYERWCHFSQPSSRAGSQSGEKTRNATGRPQGPVTTRGAVRVRTRSPPPEHLRNQAPPSIPH